MDYNYTIEPRLKQLDVKIQDTESRLLEDFKKKESSMLLAVTTVKADISNNLRNQINEFKEDISKLDESCKNYRLETDEKYNKFELTIKEHLDLQDQQNNQRDTQLYNTIDSLSKQMRRMHFDIINNEDNVAFTYVNPDGKVEYGAIKKAIPDNDTIIENKGVFKWNYKLDPKYFNIDKFHNISLAPITQLSLSSGKILSVDRLNNDLNNATYNISTLTYKIEETLKKLNSINGYVASNNFKTDKPNQQQLTEFAIRCISTNNNEITKDLIPNGTKIKNTYDQHIWVLNRTIIDGLTINKWEDFGSDNICIASNDGIHGLVTGSQNKFRGFIDINGVISINGLEEELNSIMQTLLNLTHNINELNSKINSLENQK